MNYTINPNLWDLPKQKKQSRKNFAKLTAIRKNLRGSLNRIDIQNKDGSIENLGEKYGKKLDKN